MAVHPQRLHSSPRSAVWRLGAPRVVVKVCAPHLAAREAAALRAVARTGVAPALLFARPEVIVTEALDGERLGAADLSEEAVRELGRVARTVHETARSDRAERPGHPERPRTGAGAWELALAGARADAVPSDAPLLTALRDAGPPGEAARPAFRRLHGDLWLGNALWRGTRPVLVDWEYSRLGDPAEDLAYLVEMDGIDDRAVEHLLAGYGADDALARRVEAWRPLAAAGAGLWLRARGEPERAGVLITRAARRLR
jgi:thiamine kinase